MESYEKTAYELIDFIKKSPSCYHAVENIKNELLSSGFEECMEFNSWSLKAGGKYFTCRNKSSIIAFTVPDGAIENLQIIAAHSDSPCFKIKENPEILKEKHYVSLNVEKYGGMLCSPWFDRPLSVAGKVLVSDGDSIYERLVDIGRDLLMIPSLAIHMDRKANEGHSFQIQKELIPLFGDESSEGKIGKMVADSIGVAPESIIGTDLFLYNRCEPSVWGCNKEYLSSPKLDDLQCAFSAMKAITQSQNDRSICMCCIFDNEEVGSSTKQGADSTFLQDVIDRIAFSLKINNEDVKIALSKSFMLSADNGHAVHPNYPEKNDPTNRAYLNGGVLIKYNANQKYTSDSVSSGIFKAICKSENIPMQTYVNNSDILGGSTLGNISNSHVSINTIDIGVAQLAMHSPYETCGIRDTEYLLSSMKAFYSAHINLNEKGYSLTKN